MAMLVVVVLTMTFGCTRRSGKLVVGGLRAGCLVLEGRGGDWGMCGAADWL